MRVDGLDFGFTQTGASDLRVDRPGNRNVITLSWPKEVMSPDVGAQFLSRLKRGKRQGVRIDLPCPRPQGFPGNPVVDGAGQAGSVINLRGLTPGYAAKEDFWLTLVEADGTGYLHSVFDTVRAGADGTAPVQIEPPLRAPFPDGASVHLAKPFVQGTLVGETFSYVFEELRRVPLTVTIREKK
jgi:hypothetical protein